MAMLVCFLFTHPGLVVLALLGFIALVATPRRAEPSADRPPDPAALHDKAASVPGVESVRDLQVWTLAPGFHGLTGVVTVREGASWEDVLVDVHAATRAALERSRRPA